MHTEIPCPFPWFTYPQLTTKHQQFIHNPVPHYVWWLFRARYTHTHTYIKIPMCIIGYYSLISLHPKSLTSHSHCLRSEIATTIKVSMRHPLIPTCIFSLVSFKKVLARDDLEHIVTKYHRSCTSQIQSLGSGLTTLPRQWSLTTLGSTKRTTHFILCPRLVTERCMV